MNFRGIGAECFCKGLIFFMVLGIVGSLFLGFFGLGTDCLGFLMYLFSVVFLFVWFVDVFVVSPILSEFNIEVWVGKGVLIIFWVIWCGYC